MTEELTGSVESSGLNEKIIIFCPKDLTKLFMVN